MNKWHVGDGNGTGSVFADSGRMTLEEGGTTLTPICKVYEPGQERHARLIAAAPDMLEALILCKAALRDVADILPHIETDIDISPAYATASAAISKATA